jgi:putative nucleotidyltransferase with HDIG domain
MNRFPKFNAFKYRLSFLLLVVVLSVCSFLGFFQYIIMRSSLVSSFEQSKVLIKDRILNIVRDADYINLLTERPLEAEAKEVLEAVVKKYESEKNIDFPLEPFLKNRGDMYLYIIDRNNVVVATTDKKDLGLDFSPWTDFANYLGEVRSKKTFSPARMSLSLIGAEMMKYCYMPSPDGQYVFETGALVKEQKDPVAEIGFNNFEEKVVQDNKFVDSVVLFDYQGVSYKRNKNNENMKVEPEHMSYFRKAIETSEVVETTGKYMGRKAYFQYIPYAIIGAKGANEKNVVEVIYNDSILAENLRQNVWTILLAVGAGALFAASFGFYKARTITRPIEVITEGINQVSKGNLDYSFQIDSNDEFSLLGRQFNSMTMEIRKLLDERYQSQKALEHKNREIFSQKEEITALYEETAALNEELESLLRQNQDSYFETVRALANAIEEKDSYTGGHCERVMKYSIMIAEALGLDSKEMNDLKFGSILHDIGKIGIPEHILNKEGVLSEEEFEQIRQHPGKGNHILENLQFLEGCRKIVREHHERIDGKGYPNGLKGSQIDLLARIVCVADAYDAMTSSRPYRKNPMSKEEGIRELLANSGRQFDEQMVEIFIACLNKEEKQ